MTEDIKRINIKEFREAGYLHEINRCFLHPLGLALEVTIDEQTGEEFLGGVWDYRDDPEGIVFGTISKDKIDRINRIREIKYPIREKQLGFIIQDKDITQEEWDEIKKR